MLTSIGRARVPRSGALLYRRPHPSRCPLRSVLASARAYATTRKPITSAHSPDGRGATGSELEGVRAEAVCDERRGTRVIIDGLVQTGKTRTLIDRVTWLHQRACRALTEGQTDTQRSLVVAKTGITRLEDHFLQTLPFRAGAEPAVLSPNTLFGRCRHILALEHVKLDGRLDAARRWLVSNRWAQIHVEEAFPRHDMSVQTKQSMFTHAVRVLQELGIAPEDVPSDREGLKEMYTRYEEARVASEITSEHEVYWDVVRAVEDSDEARGQFQAEFADVLVDDWQLFKPYEVALVDALWSSPGKMERDGEDVGAEKWRNVNMWVFGDSFERANVHFRPFREIEERWKAQGKSIGRYTLTQQYHVPEGVRSAVRAIRTPDVCKFNRSRDVAIYKTSNWEKEVDHVVEYLQSNVPSNLSVSILLPPKANLYPWVEALLDRGLPVHGWERKLLQNDQNIALLSTALSYVGGDDDAIKGVINPRRMAPTALQFSETDYATVLGHQRNGEELIDAIARAQDVLPPSGAAVAKEVLDVFTRLKSLRSVQPTLKVVEDARRAVNKHVTRDDTGLRTLMSSVRNLNSDALNSCGTVKELIDKVTEHVKRKRKHYDSRSLKKANITVGSMLNPGSVSDIVILPEMGRSTFSIPRRLKFWDDLELSFHHRNEYADSLLYSSLSRARSRVLITFVPPQSAPLKRLMNPAQDKVSRIIRKVAKGDVELKAAEVTAVLDGLKHQLEVPRERVDHHSDGDDDDESAARISWSMIWSFASCPRQFTYKYFAKSEQEQTKASSFGEGIHAAIARVADVDESVQSGASMYDDDVEIGRVVDRGMEEFERSYPEVGKEDKRRARDTLTSFVSRSVEEREDAVAQQAAERREMQKQVLLERDQGYAEVDDDAVVLLDEPLLDDAPTDDFLEGDSLEELASDEEKWYTKYGVSDVVEPEDPRERLAFPRPFLLEKKFRVEANIQGVDVKVVGAWDRVDEVKEGQFVVREMKTRKQGVSGVAQLILYMWAFEQQYGVAPSGYVECVTTGKKTTLKKLGKRVRSALESLLLVGARAVNLPCEEARPHRVKCSMCNFRNVCQESMANSEGANE